VYPGAGLAPALQDDGEHGDVAHGRDDHEHAVRDDGDHVALVEPHLLRQVGLVEDGRVRHVVHARPRLHGRQAGSRDYALGDRLQHLVRVRVHHFHLVGVGGGGGGGGIVFAHGVHGDTTTYYCAKIVARCELCSKVARPSAADRHGGRREIYLCRTKNDNRSIYI